ncbi:hypothetical protein [Jannaschia rubra]|uniref:hypothetical protein n=1 Tax=Jannaschia rubra TaxID=282197 RepID=UPI002491352B|nr:hypothetical protein [Jannaschia rubra]
MTRPDMPFPPSPEDVQTFCDRSNKVACALQSLERSLYSMSMDMCDEPGNDRVAAYLDIAWRMVAHLRISEAEPLDYGLNHLKRAASDHKTQPEEK